MIGSRQRINREWSSRTHKNVAVPQKLLPPHSTETRSLFTFPRQHKPPGMDLIMVVSAKHSGNTELEMWAGPSSTDSSSFSDAYSARSSASDGSNPCLSIERELTRESTWAPLMMFTTLSGFEPEDELEYNWSSDSSSTGDSVGTFASKGASITSIESSENRNNTRKGHDANGSFLVETKKSSSLVLQAVPPKTLMESAASEINEEGSKDTESRQPSIIVQSDAVLVREELIGVSLFLLLSGVDVELRLPSELSRGEDEKEKSKILNTKEVKRHLVPTPTIPSEQEEQNAALPIEDKDNLSACSSSTAHTVQASVEVTLIIREKVPRLQQMKLALGKMVSSTRKRLGMKPKEMSSSTKTPEDEIASHSSSVSPTVYRSPEDELQPPPSLLLPTSPNDD